MPLRTLEMIVPNDPFEWILEHPYLTEGGDWIHPKAPAGGGGQGSFTTPNIWFSPLIPLAHPDSPAARQLTKEEIHLAKPTATPVVLNFSGVIVAGAALSDNTVLAVNAAAKKVTTNGHRYIAYETNVQVGGSLAWRANNPGNLRNAASKIGQVYLLLRELTRRRRIGMRQRDQRREPDIWRCE